MALNWFNKLKTGLSKSASKVGGALASVTGKKTVDQLTLDNIEDQLILADLGIEASHVCVGFWLLWRSCCSRFSKRKTRSVRSL